MPKLGAVIVPSFFVIGKYSPNLRQSLMFFNSTSGTLSETEVLTMK
jgi:hypothetical protein